MADFSLKAGDVLPVYVAQLTDARGTAWTLEDAAVTFTLRHLATGTVAVDRAACTITDADTGTVTYTWQPGDTALVGYHIGQFQITFSDSTVETFPDNGHVLVEIAPQANDSTLLDTAPSLCSADDLGALLQDGLRANEAVLAQSWLLPAMEADAENYLGRSLRKIERTETGLLLLPGQDFVALHYTPVWSVSALAVDSVAWVTGSYQWERSGIRFWGPSSGFDPLASDGALSSSVDCTYIGGLGEPFQTRAKFPILTRAARILAKIRDDQLGLEALSVEAYRAQYLSEGWTTDEEKSLERCGRRLAVSSLQDPTTIPSDAAPEWWGSVYQS